MAELGCDFLMGPVILHRFLCNSKVKVPVVGKDSYDCDEGCWDWFFRASGFLSLWDRHKEQYASFRDELGLVSGALRNISC